MQTQPRKSYKAMNYEPDKTIESVFLRRGKHDLKIGNENLLLPLFIRGKLGTSKIYCGDKI